MNLSAQNIPTSVRAVVAILDNAGYPTFLVGGCVRDLIIGRTPYDWDITTAATPKQIEELFPKTVYENTFGTVAIIDESVEADDPLRSIEVTTMRTEGTYSDSRHPDDVNFTTDIAVDLQRRDFTINAIAYNPLTETTVDPFGGIADCQAKAIKAVGSADVRFKEDTLRVMRGVRFMAVLGFTIDPATQAGIIKHAAQLTSIAPERIQVEFTKTIMSDNPAAGLFALRDMNLLQYVSPELAEGVDVDQNRSHVYDVFTHNVNACQYAATQNYPLHIRLAALFHDVAKPATKGYDTKQKETTFYGHEVVGAKMTRNFMKRLKYPKQLGKDVVTLVRNHMFFSDTTQITLAAVRRVIVRVGEHLIWDLIKLRYCDRIGMGRPKADPYRLRKFESMIEQALRDPISVKMLAINGDIMINEMKLAPGRRMGWMLHALLEEVLDDPTKNTREFLENRVRAFEQLSDADMQKLGEAGKDKRDQLEKEEVTKLNKKHRV